MNLVIVFFSSLNEENRNPLITFFYRIEMSGEMFHASLDKIRN